MRGLIRFANDLVAKVRGSLGREDFLEAQSPERLEEFGLLDGEEVPEPPSPLIFMQRGYVNGVATLANALGVLDFIDERPGTTAEEVAEFVGYETHVVDAALEVLGALELLEYRGDGYAVTQAAKLYFSERSPMHRLSIDSPAIRAKAIELAKTVIEGTGESKHEAWTQGKSRSVWDFAKKMHSFSLPLGFELRHSGLLEGHDRILDIAGGAGSVCIALTLDNPDRSCTMIELPDRTRVAEEVIAQYDLLDQIECVGMDMFNDEWPQNQDAVLFTNIFHDWPEERGRLLAEKAFDCLRPGGEIFVQEALLYDDEPGPLYAAGMNLQMALEYDTGQFTASEMDELLSEAGFRNTSVHPLVEEYSSVVATKPSD